MMLILTRRVDEIIRIGENIQLVVHALSRTQVKIGVLAPRDIVVLREELLHPQIEKKEPKQQTIIKIKKKRI